MCPLRKESRFECDGVQITNCDDHLSFRGHGSGLGANNLRQFTLFGGYALHISKDWAYGIEHDTFSVAWPVLGAPSFESYRQKRTVTVTRPLGMPKCQHDGVDGNGAVL